MRRLRLLWGPLAQHAGPVSPASSQVREVTRLGEEHDAPAIFQGDIVANTLQAVVEAQRVVVRTRDKARAVWGVCRREVEAHLNASPAPKARRRRRDPQPCSFRYPSWMLHATDQTAHLVRAAAIG
jgi:hypothetical protein